LRPKGGTLCDLIPAFAEPLTLTQDGITETGTDAASRPGKLSWKPPTIYWSSEGLPG
jgi:hypothetical protein